MPKKPSGRPRLQAHCQPPPALEAFCRQAEEALAQEGVGPGHVGYGLLLKLRTDDLIEAAFQPAEVQG